MTESHKKMNGRLCFVKKGDEYHKKSTVHLLTFT